VKTTKIKELKKTVLKTTTNRETTNLIFFFEFTTLTKRGQIVN